MVQERKRQKKLKEERLRRRTERAEEAWLSSRDKREWDRNQTLIKDYAQRSDGTVAILGGVLFFINSMMILAGLLMVVFAQHYKLLLFFVITLSVGGAAWKFMKIDTGSEIPRLKEENARIHDHFIQRHLDK